MWVGEVVSCCVGSPSSFLRLQEGEEGMGAGL